jgi:hypothetical protein
MSKLTDETCRLIEQASEEEQRTILAYLRERVSLHPLETQWSTTAEEILTAIARSSDLTLRGIRGVIAEGIFEKRLLPKIEADGWNSAEIVGDQAYDFLIERGESRVNIQVKLQRKQMNKRTGRVEPKEYGPKVRKRLNCPKGTMYAVEVQKTRSGEKNGKKTRPYHFGDFDILAVNLQPATGKWERFMFTVGSWLLPRAKEPDLIEIFQPVPITPDEYWTNDLSQCIEWSLSGEQKRIYS